jgi:hypothetical protein
VEVGQGTGPPGRADDRGAQKDTGKVTSNRPSKPEIFKGQSFAVSDGRDALGTVERVGNSFTAIDTAGEIIGTFPTLRVASRSFGGHR